MQEQSKSERFWPTGAQLATSISLMFEGGSQPISGAFSPDMFGDFFFVANRSERANQGGKRDANTSS
jgi:hypothetical protein